MDKVLSIISGYVATCTSCHFGKVGNCEYINPHTPPSPEKTPIDMEEYRKLTHQQKAFPPSLTKTQSIVSCRNTTSESQNPVTQSSIRSTAKEDAEQVRS